MEEIIVGIDIGTTKVCTLIGKIDKNDQLQILGRGFTLFSGVKKGVIVDIEKTAEAIRASVEEAEGEANFKVNSAYVNIYGTHVNIINHKESTSVLSDNQVVTQEDIEKMLQSIERLPVSEGNRIIDIIPRQYIVDGFEGIMDPIGMSGLILEMEADVVTGKLTSVQNIIRSVEKAGLEVDGIITEAYATSELSLLPEEKEMGVILIDVGGGITDVSAFKNGRIIMYDSIPVGGEHVTNDIAIGLRISYSEADKLKKQYELALTTLIKNDQEISVYDVNEEKLKDVQVSRIIKIIEARVCEILSLAKKLVEKYENLDTFRAGVVLTGGGISYVNGNKQIAEDIFNLPVRVASYRSVPGAAKPEYAAAAGIIKHAAKRNMYSRISRETREMRIKDNHNGKGGNYFKRIAKAIYSWFSM
ncbi:MAG: cell division protein FtsA [Clostridiaceae bacterium]|nr:cell division protein FtsA [Clostridiaceae bacterium]